MEPRKRVTIVKQKQRTQAVCVITIKKINMSEKELKQEKTSKLVVGSTFVLLVGALLLLSTLSSCSSKVAHCQGNVWGAAASCPAYR